MYRPGWDCHGLPIEMKALGSAGTKGLSPVEIRKRARKLATKTVADQMKEFQSFAVMSEWDNKWTTMDREFETRQLRVFQKMVRRGLIYRKHKPVYWSPSSRTALAEAELEYRDDHESNTAYVRFPIASDISSISGLGQVQGNLYAAIWTTTPWTLPSNRAIAVHDTILYSVLQADGFAILVASSRTEELLKHLPGATVVAQDIPGSELVGLQYRNKLRGAQAPLQQIIHADFVTEDSGTGLVHLAPGHGQDDYEVCAKMGIDAFAPITDDGHFTADAYPDHPEKLLSAPSILEGGSKAVLELVGEDVLGTYTLQHKYPYDWRTKQPVVIRATAQWFADVASIKEDALASLQNVRFIPESGRVRLESFVKGRSEWCISRQRSWGVPIPVLYDAKGDAVMTEESIDHIISVMQERGSDAWFADAPDDPAWIAPSLHGSFRRGTDTMDVWFDSGSSWTEIQKPVDVYLEGSDQHRGWFQSSLLSFIASQRADGVASDSIFAPFRTLMTHGFTLDTEGKKMSKSIGNTISPQEVIEGKLLPNLRRKGKDTGVPDALGPDALRLWAGSCDATSDILIGATVLQPVHNSLIRYRTILKMLLGSLHKSSRTAPLSKLDQIALLELSDVMKQVWEAYNNYEFHKGVGHINRWVSTELSAFYLEALKDRLYCGDGGGALEPMLIGMLRMLAPITPMLVEEAWANRPEWMAADTLSPARHEFNAPLVEQNRLSLSPENIRRDYPVIGAIHNAIKNGLEQARESKVVGSSLHCTVVIASNDALLVDCVKEYLDELDSIFVVSSVDLNSSLPEQPEWHFQSTVEYGDARGTVHVLPPQQHKCSRCWKYIAEEEDGLCGRCDEVVGQTSAAQAA